MLLDFDYRIQLYLILQIYQIPNVIFIKQFLIKDFIKNKVLSTYKDYKLIPLLHHNKFDGDLKKEEEFVYMTVLIKTVEIDFNVRTHSSQKTERQKVIIRGKKFGVCNKSNVPFGHQISEFLHRHCHSIPTPVYFPLHTEIQ